MRKTMIFLALALVAVFASSAFAAGEVTIYTGRDTRLTVASYPSDWEVVSVQRHGLPLNLSLTPNTWNVENLDLVAELNSASKRLSEMYTVSFRTAEKTTKVMTIRIPGDEVVFAPNNNPASPK